MTNLSVFKRVVSPNGAEWDTFDACVASVKDWDGMNEEDANRMCGAWHQKMQQRDEDRTGTVIYGPLCEIPIGKMARALRSIGKDRVYVDSPREVPEDREVQEGPEGGLYYETGEPRGADDRRTTEDEHPDTEPNPEADIEQFMNDEDIGQQIEKTNEEPEMGFTLHRNLEQQELGDRDEWAVGVGGVKLDREIEKEDIVDIYEEFLPLLQAYPGVRIGGYHFAEGGTFSLDITVTLTDEDEAEELGERLNQESIFNLGTMDLVQTGGDGNSPYQDASPEEMGEEVFSGLESLSEKAREHMLDILTMKVEVTDAMRDRAREFANEKRFRHTETGVFVTPDAEDAKTFYQIAMNSAKDSDVTVDDVGGGAYEVDGRTYQHVELTEADGGQVQAALSGMQNGMQKERVYIDYPTEAPAWASPKRGPQGGLYYEAELSELPAAIRSLIEEIGPQIEMIMNDALDEASIRLPDANVQEQIQEAVEMAEPVIVEELAEQLGDSMERDVIEELAPLVAERYVGSSDSLMLSAEKETDADNLNVDNLSEPDKVYISQEDQAPREQDVYEEPDGQLYYYKQMTMTLDKDELAEGETYYDRENETEITIAEIEGGDVHATTGTHEWVEDEESAMQNIREGSWVHLPDDNVATPMDDEKSTTDSGSVGFGMMNKAEFNEGEAVQWTWQGNPVHGRVSEIREEQATVSGNTITGEEGEPVYIIDEYDEEEGGFKNGNVAKPESSLNESQRDLPDRTEGNMANSDSDGLRPNWEAQMMKDEDPCWDSHTMVGLQPDGSPRCVPKDEVDENYDPEKAEKTYGEMKKTCDGCRGDLLPMTCPQCKSRHDPHHCPYCGMQTKTDHSCGQDSYGYMDVMGMSGSYDTDMTGGGSGGGRVFVASASQAPDEKTVKQDADGLLYYER